MHAILSKIHLFGCQVTWLSEVKWTKSLSPSKCSEFRAHICRSLWWLFVHPVGTRYLIRPYGNWPLRITAAGSLLRCSGSVRPNLSITFMCGGSHWKNGDFLFRDICRSVWTENPSLKTKRYAKLMASNLCRIASKLWHSVILDWIIYDLWRWSMGVRRNRLQVVWPALPALCTFGAACKIRWIFENNEWPLFVTFALPGEPLRNAVTLVAIYSRQFTVSLWMFFATLNVKNTCQAKSQYITGSAAV